MTEYDLILEFRVIWREAFEHWGNAESVFDNIPINDMAHLLNILKKQESESIENVKEFAKHPGRRWRRSRELVAKLPMEEAFVARIDDWLRHYGVLNEEIL